MENLSYEEKFDILYELEKVMSDVIRNKEDYILDIMVARVHDEFTEGLLASIIADKIKNPEVRSYARDYARYLLEEDYDFRNDIDDFILDEIRN